MTIPQARNTIQPIAARLLRRCGAPSDRCSRIWADRKSSPADLRHVPYRVRRNAM